MAMAVAKRTGCPAKAPLAEKGVGAQHRHNRFLTCVGEDPELHASVLNVENPIAGSTLRVDDLSAPELDDLPCYTTRIEKRLDVERWGSREFHRLFVCAHRVLRAGVYVLADQAQYDATPASAAYNRIHLAYGRAAQIDLRRRVSMYFRVRQPRDDQRCIRLGLRRPPATRSRSCLRCWRGGSRSLLEPKIATPRASCFAGSAVPSTVPLSRVFLVFWDTCRIPARSAKSSECADLGENLKNRRRLEDRLEIPGLPKGRAGSIPPRHSRDTQAALFSHALAVPQSLGGDVGTVSARSLHRHPGRTWRRRLVLQAARRQTIEPPEEIDRLLPTVVERQSNPITAAILSPDHKRQWKSIGPSLKRLNTIQRTARLHLLPVLFQLFAPRCRRTPR